MFWGSFCSSLLLYTLQIPFLTMKKTGPSSNKPHGSSVSLKYQVAILCIAMIPSYLTYKAKTPLSYVLPNALLYTPFRETARSLWHSVIEIDFDHKKDPKPVPEMDAADYSYEKLRELTSNFRYPAVVRGLFKGTPAVEHWEKSGYLSSKLGEYTVPVIRNAATDKVQGDRYSGNFSTVYESMLVDESSQEYLFFPVLSRFHLNATGPRRSIEDLKTATNKLIREDLDLDRIWYGFGTKAHSTYKGAQFIAGRGQKTVEETTKTDWHCAMGSNFFVQAIGRKRWYFMVPEHSALMHPVRQGQVSMMTGHKDMGKVQDYIDKIQMVDLEAGDLLYNPDWSWHSIQNHEGMSIGVPLREFNWTNSVRNNIQFSSVVILSQFLNLFGLDFGGYAS